ncbi:CBN-TAG-347 protein [Caenorhabditis brenneri]|uniref:CBN-TAG-347 protein n=1 Tax=Caenorhabditis brenneri TaxID=135651 RepID=G0N5C2_CAEBE|nr:CBN-TAG-347 protein [Caenorhabditis brenneri]
MCDEDGMSMSPPPSLSPHPIGASFEGFKTEELERGSPLPLHSPINLDHGPLHEDDKSAVYQIMYAQPELSDSGYIRPVTPLQITIPDGDASPTVPVSCGVVTGKMHLNLFMCPGIHQPCIEVGNDLLSPKQFTVRGDKERQKDWKASIRVGRSSLRTHMEASTIDFYDHQNRCSGKCQSRNYVNAPTDEALQARKNKRSSEAALLKNEIENEITGREAGMESGIDNEKEEKKPNMKKARGRPRGSVNKPRSLVKIEPEDDSFFEEFFTDAPPPPIPPQAEPEPLVHLVNEPAPPVMPDIKLHNECSSYGEILNCLQNDPMNFWSQMQNSGVIGHFCDDIIVSAINLKQTALEQAVTPNTANMLTRTAFSLGIQSVIVHRVQSIERNVYQQRKHDEMFMEIQAKLAEEQRLKSQQNPSTSAASDESLRTALEMSNEHDDELVDVGKYETYSEAGDTDYHHMMPGPSHLL